MQLLHVADSQQEEWDAFAAEEPSFSLMQSWKWGEFKRLLGWLPFRIAIVESGRIVAGAQVLIKTACFGLMSVAYIPRGPIGAWLSPERAHLLLSEIHRIARHYRAVFLKIEPMLLASATVEQRLVGMNFLPSENTSQPRTTIHIDLTQSLESILAGMRRKTRQAIKRSLCEGITVRQGSDKDLPAFYDLVRLTGKRDSFPVRRREYYESEYRALMHDGNSVLLMASHENQLLAARTIHCFGKHAAEFDAGSVGSKLLHPNYRLVWEALNWTKSRGCRTYDLWGIPDDVARFGESGILARRKGDLWGVYQFKTGFSDSIVSYIGAFDYVYNPWLYDLLGNISLSSAFSKRILVWMDAIQGRHPRRVGSLKNQARE